MSVPCAGEKRGSAGRKTEGERDGEERRERGEAEERVFCGRITERG